jgi:hypothetical protein
LSKSSLINVYTSTEEELLRKREIEKRKKSKLEKRFLLFISCVDPLTV